MEHFTKYVALAKPNSRLGPRYFQSRRPSWRHNAQFDKYLLIIAITCLSASLLMLAVGGLQLGFWQAHDTGRALFNASIWANITYLGDTYTALAIALLFSHRYPHIATAILISAIAGTVLIHGFKHALDTPRPPALLLEQGLDVIGPHYKRNSMPSGHTATAFILATLLTRCISTHWKKALIIGVAGLVAWSRVACGVHWLTDVLAGAGVGIIGGLIGLWASDRIRLTQTLYLFVCALLGYAAFTLLNYDGDLPSTQATGQIIGFSALFYWVSSWLFEFANSTFRRLNSGTTPV